jgi:hypothetical protein
LRTNNHLPNREKESYKKQSCAYNLLQKVQKDFIAKGFGKFVIERIGAGT